MIKRFGPYCNRCQKWIDIDDLTVDHIIPHKMGLQGGEYQRLDNRQLLCIYCQRMKSVLELAFKRRIPSRKRRHLLF